MSSAGKDNPETSPQAEKRRLFLALWPDENLRGCLQRLLDKTPSLRGGRPEPIANLHVTLVFIGNIEGDRVAAIERAAAGLSGAAFDLVFDRSGYWERPRILWLGLRETPAALYSLVMDLRVALARCGIAPEARPYLPHMTLARKVTHPPPEVAIEPIPWRVNSYSLMESVPLDRGSTYRELAAWPLRSGDK